MLSACGYKQQLLLPPLAKEDPMTKTNRLARKCVHFKLEALVKRLHEGDDSGDYSRAQLAAKDLLKEVAFLGSYTASLQEEA